MRVSKELLEGLGNRLMVEPLTAADIATELNVGAPTVRRWLRMLESAGFKVTTLSMRIGRGRPARVFSAEKVEG